MEKLKFGIIGLGSMGLWYIKTLQQYVPEAELIAASSRNLEELERVESEFGIKQNYVDFRDMLGLHELDAVIIASETMHRVRQASEAMDKGLHVLVMTPIANNVSDCDKLIQKDQRYPNQIGMAGMIKRFSPVVQEARKAIRDGSVGDVVGIKCWTSVHKIPKKEQSSPEVSSASLFMDHGIQDIDVIHYLLGSEINQIYSLSQSVSDKEKHELEVAWALGKLESGPLVDLKIIVSSSRENENNIEVIGTKGRLILNDTNWTIGIKSDQGIELISQQATESKLQPALTKQINSFVHAIKESGKTPVSITEAKEATKVSVALSKSLALNEVIEIS